MKVQGERTFAARREVVWRVLNDPKSMAELMPGVESFEVEDDRHWKANVKVPLGLGGLKMAINFEKLEERELEYSALSAKGTGVGALMSMQTAFNLSDAEGGTSMRWEADVKIAGPVGGMGQRVLQPIVNQQVANVLNALDKKVQEESAGEPQSDPPVVMGAAPAVGEPLAEGAQHGGTGDVGSSTSGSAGTPPPTTDIPAPATDPEVKDAGPPAESTPEADPASVEGTSGAEHGLNPWDSESYRPDPEGPRTSTEG